MSTSTSVDVYEHNSRQSQNTTLYCATEKSYVDVVKLVVRKHKKIADSGWVIVVPTLYGHLDIVRFLVESIVSLRWLCPVDNAEVRCTAASTSSSTFTTTVEFSLSCAVRSSEGSRKRPATAHH